RMSYDFQGSILRFAVIAVISVFVAVPQEEDRRPDARQQSISAIRKLGGDVFREEGVLMVYLTGPDVTDAALIHLIPLSELGWLDLSWSRITDAGLAALRPFKNLRELDLSDTRITGAGLKHLKVLPKLHSLELSNCPINNKGLANLEVLVSLDDL